jgi:ElaB/YqjD/DUF883 family membrane-anchored ribosome-binding protein
MLVARNAAFSQKRDLHIGGLGANARAEPATVADPQARVVPFLRQARKVVQNANYALRNDTWAALGLGAALGLTVGYLLSRRT